MDCPEKAIAEADCVLLLLADAAAIRAVPLAPSVRAVLRGRTVIQMGTIGSDESLGLGCEVAREGAEYLEAPVLGSIAEARAGTLLVMVGADTEQFQRWEPLFRSLGRKPRWVGPVGKAPALKLALNQLIAAEITAFSLSLGLVQRSGIAPDTFMAVLRESALFAPMFDKKLPRLLARDYANPNFSTRHLLKDVDLIMAEAKGLGLSSGSLEAVRRHLERCMDAGLGDADYSAIFEVIDRRPQPDSFDAGLS